MCREPPWREPQLTRVSKSSQDAICHTGNRWRSWPLPTPKSSQTDQTRWLLPPKGVSGRRWQRHENQVILYKFSWRNVEARRLHICRSCGDYAAQRVSTSVATGSRLCIRHQSDVGGCTRLERGGGGGGHDIDVLGSLSFMVSDRKKQISPLPFTWESQLAAILKQEKRLCGKIQLQVSESLNVS